MLAGELKFNPGVKPAQSLEFCSTTRTFQFAYIRFLNHVSSTVETHTCSAFLAKIVSALNTFSTDHTGFSNAFLRQFLFLFMFLFQILTYQKRLLQHQTTPQFHLFFPLFATSGTLYYKLVDRQEFWFSSFSSLHLCF